MRTVKRGSIVTFRPSKNRNKEFQNPKADYPAMVTEVNENSVDLTVFGVGEEVHVFKVQHSSLAPEGRSKWDEKADEDDMN